MKNPIFAIYLPSVPFDHDGVHATGREIFFDDGSSVVEYEGDEYGDLPAFAYEDIYATEEDEDVPEEEIKRFYVHGAYDQGDGIEDEDLLGAFGNYPDALALAKNQLPVWDVVRIYFGTDEDYYDHFIVEFKEEV